MKIELLTVGPLEENCYLLIDESTNRAVLIDPGDEPERILAALRRSGATLEGIWLTHAHFDHVGALAGVVREHPVPVHMHPLDQPWHDRAVDAALRYGFIIEAPPPVDRTLAEGDVVMVGTERLRVMHVPGHAPGHVAFYNDEVVFGGDCLFAGSIGTTEIELGDRAALDASVARLIALGDERTLYPGHGPATTLGRERLTNPFVMGTARLVRLKR